MWKRCCNLNSLPKKTISYLCGSVYYDYYSFLIYLFNVCYFPRFFIGTLINFASQPPFLISTQGFSSFSPLKNTGVKDIECFEFSFFIINVFKFLKCDLASYFTKIWINKNCAKDCTFKNFGVIINSQLIGSLIYT